MNNRHEIQVFSSEWFEYHQAKLLLLANSMITRGLFREIIKFELSDNKICNITPNAVHCINEDDTFTGYFYSGDFNAQQLYLNLEAFWKLLHVWDIYVANKINKKLNFGFDTLTAYSLGWDNAIGFPYFYALNFYVIAGTNFANARGFLATQTNDGEQYTNQHKMEIYNNGSGLLFYGLHPRIKFNTISIPSFANITSATLSVNKFNTGAVSLFSSSIAIRVYKGRSPNNVLDGGNGYWNNAHSWENWSLDSKTYADYNALTALSPSGYLVFNLNSNGLSNILKNGTTGVTMMYVGWDNFVSDVAFPTTANAYCTMRFASVDANPTINQYRPILTVEYSTAAITNKVQMIV